MLTGGVGIGKTTTARLLACALNYSSEDIDEATLDISTYGHHCEDIMD